MNWDISLADLWDTISPFSVLNKIAKLQAFVLTYTQNIYYSTLIKCPAGKKMFKR